MQLRILKSAALSTIQDKGRWSSRSRGVPVGGAMDTVAYRLANGLLMNPESAPAIEVGNGYFAATAEAAGRVACIGGGELWLDGRLTSRGRAYWVPKGGLLEIKPGKWGNYSYLAVSGGWTATWVLQSASTCLAAGFGGLEGRSLHPGDVLSARTEAYPDRPINYGLSMRHFGNYGCLAPKEVSIVRVLPGPEDHWWTEDQKAIFAGTDFEISRECNRMGIRLTLATNDVRQVLQEPALAPQGVSGMLSAGISIGAIQVPNGGQPIVLCADAQTTGGYPRIAQVVTVDMPLLVQVPVGGKVRFQWIEMAEAEYLHFQLESKMQRLKKALLFCK